MAISVPSSLMRLLTQDFFELLGKSRNYFKYVADDIDEILHLFHDIEQRRAA
jgi:hypothetical protein